MILWLACSAPNDSAVVQDTDWPACAEGPLPSGEAPDLEACAEGVCPVEAGTFWMGATDIVDACPARDVELSADTIDLHEVTVGQWAACVQAGVCQELPSSCETEADHDDPDKVAVTCATWDEAQALCDWKGGRLPTEAEWEKAARGPEGAEWAWGSTPPDCLVANYRYAAGYCHYGVVDVGWYPTVRSPYGLLDTVGNAWEWVADWYAEDAYATLPDEDPVLEDCVASDVGDCTFRVIRGGGLQHDGREHAVRLAQLRAAGSAGRQRRLPLRVRLSYFVTVRVYSAFPYMS